jgi:hypothetical protein
VFFALFAVDSILLGGEPIGRANRCPRFGLDRHGKYDP